MLGLVVVAWVADACSNNPMVLGVCLLIAVVYLIGGAELQRYRKATAGLQTALDTLQDTPAELRIGCTHWMSRCALRWVCVWPASAWRCRPPPCRRICPGCWYCWACWAHLLGMMVTLRGTGIALESASDLQAIVIRWPRR